ncbi:Bowman-Birk type trypsin inhibitor precursor [Iris pallida]|uniref:Bowman-Birk type trypsin inhibitor n=1 Tax=Iris pallida TaxID=29817 RepID=A0AAX6EGD6_IRIPA|nr:Bowman-Birk type trypsin inhibitor precursor [Iris pallida]
MAFDSQAKVLVLVATARTREARRRERERESKGARAGGGRERMKKMGVGSLAMALLIIMTILMCVATGSQHDEELEKDGLRLPSQGAGTSGEGGSRKPWSCCDRCICTRSNPPRCTCEDMLVGKCHPRCESCEQLPMQIYPPYFVCRDAINEYCGEPCHPEQLLE